MMLIYNGNAMHSFILEDIPYQNCLTGWNLLEKNLKISLENL
jgi:hypothetical protein